ncbi:MAG: tRNA adenosine(34) deaminase TadA [Neisseria sp.]|nr:tRNA adenosine(34) deaminase TadA [Neisseria sp.]
MTDQALPPFAPSTLRTLRQLGLNQPHLLRQTGAVKAFLLLKAAGLTVTRSVLWQLAAACDPRHTPPGPETQNALLAAVKQHPPVALPPDRAQALHWMGLALQQAEQAARQGEIPVGAVIVKNGLLLAAARNDCRTSHDISRHAEICALAQAGRRLGNFRLDGCDAYITLEPCTMCASALIQARVARVMFGASEPKTGAAGSVIDLFADKRLNSHTAVFGGLMAEESQNILQHFFQQRRKQKGLT